MSTIQSTPGDPAIITDPSYVIDYTFPPTNYQHAPVPTEDTEDGGPATAKNMTSAQRMAYILKPGELVYDTDLELLYVGDGTTPGGIVVESGSGGDFTRVVFHDPAN